MMKHKKEIKEYILFHNARCSKSRACLKIIQKKSITFKELHYLKEGLDLSILKNIINNLVNPLGDIIRTNEKDFKSNSFDINNRKLVISFLNKHPICMQRPLFFNGTNYIICRPPETVLKFL